MEKKLLRRLLDEEHVCLVLKAGEEFEIQPQLSVKMSGEGLPEWIYTGYTVTCGDTERSLGTSAEAISAVGEECELVSVNGFGSLEEYLSDKAFKNIDMAGLLEKYLPISDEFSLTCTFNRYDKEHPFGIYGISSVDAGHAVKGVEEWARKKSSECYERLPDEQKSELPEFDALYEKICAEYEKFAGRKEKFRQAHGGEVFFGDEFYRGKTEYSHAEGLYGIYQAVDFAGLCRYSVERMKKNPMIRPADCQLTDEYERLKGSLARVETSFVWHCTASGQLSKIFYFRLDDASVGWLKNLKDDYDLCGLEDLAFYKDGKCVFSSCTHERFHLDLSAEK